MALVSRKSIRAYAKECADVFQKPTAMEKALIDRCEEVSEEAVKQTVRGLIASAPGTKRLRYEKDILPLKL